MNRYWLMSAVFCFSSYVNAFGISPKLVIGGKIKSGRKYSHSIPGWVIEKVSDPVHEKITKQAFCDDEQLGCASYPEDVLDAVTYGVWWNDNPPFRFNKGKVPIVCRPYVKSWSVVVAPNYSFCWGAMLADAKNISDSEEFQKNMKPYVILYRSHFGDLQYLHAMASNKMETAEKTKSKIFGWIKFLDGVVRGDVNANTKLGEVDSDQVKDAFPNKLGWRVSDLLAMNARKYHKSISDVAFGSMLHIVQDSFSLAHVDRLPATGEACPTTTEIKKAGNIGEFHIYVGQSTTRHGARDSMIELNRQMKAGSPNVVDVSRELRKMYYRDKSDWASVEKFLDQCVFNLEPGQEKQRPTQGDEFKA